METHTIITVALTVGGSTATALITALGLGFKIRGWLSTIQVDRIQALSDLKDDLHGLIDRHEQKDQERHEENLGRFATVNERLARLGNGSH